MFLGRRCLVRPRGALVQSAEASLPMLAGALLVFRPSLTCVRGFPDLMPPRMGDRTEMGRMCASMTGRMGQRRAEGGRGRRREEEGGGLGGVGVAPRPALPPKHRRVCEETPKAPDVAPPPKRRRSAAAAQGALPPPPKRRRKRAPRSARRGVSRSRALGTRQLARRRHVASHGPHRHLLAYGRTTRRAGARPRERVRAPRPLGKSVGTRGLQCPRRIHVVVACASAGAFSSLACGCRREATPLSAR